MSRGCKLTNKELEEILLKSDSENEDLSEDEHDNRLFDEDSGDFEMIEDVGMLFLTELT